MKILYKYAILPIATGEVYDAVKSGKWIAGQLAEQLLLDIDKLKDKPKKAIRLSVVAEWPDEEEGGEE